MASNMKFRFVTFFAFVLLSAAAIAQNKVSGRVIDKDNGEPLPGATITILDTKRGSISNKNGIFEIENIKENPIRLRINYIGYDADTISHNFNTKKNPFFNVELASLAAEMDEVTVEGEAEGQMKAFIEQREAVNIINVVSSEQIEQFPDLNAAEAMQRIPGITLQRDQGEGKYVQLRGTPPELTNFNINGEQIPSPESGVRYVGMDIISADQIDFIEISKVLTPDMDADGIAGNVNIITKKATSEIPEIRATMSGGYGNLRQSGNYQLQFSYGQRRGDFGFHLNSSYYQNNQGSDNMEFKYAKGPFWGSTGEGNDNYHIQYREVQLRHYNITRERIGLSATFDYDLGNNSSLYLRGMLNQFSDNELRRVKVYDLDDAISERYYLYGGIEHDMRERLEIQKLNTINFGGDFDLNNLFLNFELSYGVAAEDEPDKIQAIFENPGQAIAMKFNTDNPDYPVVTYPDPENAQNATEYDRYDLEELIFETTNVRDRNLTAKVNFTIPYKFGTDNAGHFKFGGKARFKNKTADITSQVYSAYFMDSKVYPGEGDTLSLERISSDFSEDNLLDKGYLIDYMPDPGKMRNFFEFFPQFFIYDRTATKAHSNGEDYSAKEDIYAVYGMVRHDLGNIMLLGGLRWEETDIDYSGRLIQTRRGNFESLDTLYDKRTHTFVLPQFQVRYAIDDLSNLRGAVTYTYSRPNFEDVLPYREQDREEVRYGNPDLIFPTSLNFDLLGETYLTAGGGILSGGLFYKKIDDFIFYFKRFAHEGVDFSDYGLVEIEKSVNGIEAEVYGAEIQAQFKFDFLKNTKLDFLSNFGIYTNYTFTESFAYINQRYPANYADAVVIFGEDDLSLYQNDSLREELKLPGQAKHTTNIALYYDDGLFYTKISANYHDAFLYSLGADEDLDVYYDEAWHLDFTVNYALTENIKFFADVINLTNAPLKFYLGKYEKDEDKRILQQEFYSWWGRIGVKLSY